MASLLRTPATLRRTMQLLRASAAPVHCSAAAGARVAAFQALGATPSCFTVRCQSTQAPEARSTEPPPEDFAEAEAAAAAADPRDVKLKELATEVTSLKALVAEGQASRVRLLAEMENVRTIAKRDVDNAKNYSVQSMAKRLLDVVDNLQRAVESVPTALRTKDAAGGFGVLYDGVVATERDFLKTLDQFGIKPFGVAGEKFDYNRHEAMLHVPAAPGQEANAVAQVLKTGFMMRDRVLRPAQVSVTVPAQ